MLVAVLAVVRQSKAHQNLLVAPVVVVFFHRMSSDSHEDFQEAEAYDQSNVRQIEDGLALIKRIDPKKGDQVLDLGCGTGNITKVLADLVKPGGKVVGIDPDETRIKIAKEKYAASNIEYLVAGTANMPGEEYDLIYCNYVLHWVKNNETIFRDTVKILKKDGRFSFIVLDTITQETIDKDLGWASKEFQQGYVSRLHGLSVRDVERLAATYNFKVDYVAVGAYALKFKNADEYIEGYLVHGGLDRKMFNEEDIKEFYGPGEINLSIPTTVAILRKI